MCVFLIIGTNVSAYSADTAIQKQAETIVSQIQKKLIPLSLKNRQKAEARIHANIVLLQNKLIWNTQVSVLTKNALYEMIRRKLYTDSFETTDVIFDDGVGAIWNHASKGLWILYNPVSTPTIGALSSGTKNILVNGSYFSRKDGTQYHSGLLWSRGVLWSEMVYGDSQITHVVCLDTHNRVTFWPNSTYFDGLMDACEIAFQAWPMIYSLQDGIVEENLAPQNYIGRPHNRTVMVFFEDDWKQDLWLLTLIKPTTLAEVRDVVLRESRFRGEYDTLKVFNLDGWSSVAHRNPDHPELNFWSSKALPVVFEIYK